MGFKANCCKKTVFTISLITILTISTFASSSFSYAVTMNQYVTCSLVYGALFQAAKNANHEGMIKYCKPRLQAVLPYVQDNMEDPVAKQKLREISILLEDEIKNKFVSEATDAIIENNPDKLQASMSPVFQCDKVFGLSSLPLPLKSSTTSDWNKFLQGFYSGCLAKQKQNASPYSDAQIQKYCQCITNQAASAGVNSNSSEKTTAKIINESHGICFAGIQ